MEKDIDEVGKIARSVKAKLEAINKDVILKYLFLDWKTFDSVVSFSELCTDFLSAEFSQPTEAWMREGNRCWQSKDEHDKVCAEWKVLNFRFLLLPFFRIIISDIQIIFEWQFFDKKV